MSNARTRLTWACLRCKKKKVSCDSGRPSCSRCEKQNTPCIYLQDKRIDKKSSSQKNKKRVNVPEKAQTEIPVSSELPKSYLRPDNSTVDFNFDKFMGYWNSDCLEIEEDTINHSLLPDFDINQFLKYLDDDASPIIDPVKVEQSPHIDLIESVFQNKTHPPPGIVKQYIIDIDHMYYGEKKDLPKDAIFLLSTILCLGALTLAKRDLLAQKIRPNEITVSDAFTHYQKAKSYLTDILENPSINGFLGLVLMANFMTLMLSLEGQMFLCFNALQIAVSLGLNIQPFEGEGDNHIILFWSLWCSSCMLAGFHGRQSPLNISDIKVSRPIDLLSIENYGNWGGTMFNARIDFAQAFSLAHQVSKLGPGQEFDALATFVNNLSNHLENLKSIPSADFDLYNRRIFYFKELECWRAQTIMLLYSDQLVRGRSLNSVLEAQRIIRDLWFYYTYDFPENQERLISYLDWNFSYPFRTASLTVWIACVIIHRYKQSVPYLEHENIVEFQIGYKTLKLLVKIIPIEHHLLESLDKLLDGTISTNSYCNFWLKRLYESS